MTCKEHHTFQIAALLPRALRNASFNSSRSFLLPKHGARMSHRGSRLRSRSLAKAILQRAVSDIPRASRSLFPDPQSPAGQSAKSPSLVPTSGSQQASGPPSPHTSVSATPMSSLSPLPLPQHTWADPKRLNDLPHYSEWGKKKNLPPPQPQALGCYK